MTFPKTSVHTLSLVNKTHIITAFLVNSTPYQIFTLHLSNAMELHIPAVNSTYKPVKLPSVVTLMQWNR